MSFSARRGLVVVFVLVTLIAPGCSRPSSGTGDATGDVQIDLAISPNPPKVGDAEAIVTLKSKDGQPIRGATVKLEGNMNHAGMEPVFAAGKEAEPGQYKADMKFTMGGDWFILVNATLSDGRKMSRKVDVLGVKTR
jgi:hypothetical protein